eukprot:Amastigsp_a340791_30.p4 type:complete len:147 gc:universal Amastigsp_a340791_30:1979-2419(+)
MASLAVSTATPTTPSTFRSASSGTGARRTSKSTPRRVLSSCTRFASEPRARSGALNYRRLTATTRHRWAPSAALNSARPPPPLGPNPIDMVPSSALLCRAKSASQTATGTMNSTIVVGLVSTHLCPRRYFSQYSRPSSPLTIVWYG